MLGRLGSMQHAKGYDEDDEYGEGDEDDEDDDDDEDDEGRCTCLSNLSPPSPSSWPGTLA